MVGVWLSWILEFSLKMFLWWFAVPWKSIHNLQLVFYRIVQVPECEKKKQSCWKSVKIFIKLSFAISVHRFLKCAQTYTYICMYMSTNPCKLIAGMGNASKFSPNIHELRAQIIELSTQFRKAWAEICNRFLSIPVDTSQALFSMFLSLLGQIILVLFCFVC